MLVSSCKTFIFREEETWSEPRRSLESSGIFWPPAEIRIIVPEVFQEMRWVFQWWLTRTYLPLKPFNPPRVPINVVGLGSTAPTFSDLLFVISCDDGRFSHLLTSQTQNLPTWQSDHQTTMGGGAERFLVDLVLSCRLQPRPPQSVNEVMRCSFRKSHDVFSTLWGCLSRVVKSWLHIHESVRRQWCDALHVFRDSSACFCFSCF